MKLKYCSHSAFQITTDDGMRILIDPFFEGNPTSPVKACEFETDTALFKEKAEQQGTSCQVLAFGQEITL